MMPPHPSTNQYSGEDSSPLWELPPEPGAGMGAALQVLAAESSTWGLQLLLPSQLESIQTMKYLTGY